METPNFNEIDKQKELWFICGIKKLYNYFLQFLIKLNTHIYDPSKLLDWEEQSV